MRAEFQTNAAKEVPEVDLWSPYGMRMRVPAECAEVLGLELDNSSIVGATGSGSPGSGPFTTIRRYDDTKSLRGHGGPGVLGEEQKRAKNMIGPCGGLSPGDPENRIRGAILRILVVGELRGMTSKLFYAKLRKNHLSQVLLAPTIPLRGACNQESRN